MKIFTYLFFLFTICTTVIYSQNITNTVGSSGTFYIKDGSTNFLTITQSTGQTNILKGLRLELTGNSSTTGVIFKGTNRFIHDFKPLGANGFNTFVGINSGNFTMNASSSTNASYNTGVGYSSLSSLTTGYFNTSLGFYSLKLNTSGYNNTAIGYLSLSSSTTGSNNSALGNNTLSANTTGSYNTALGNMSLSNNTTGSSNSALGTHSLYSNIDGRNNTALGYYVLYSNTSGSFNTASGNSALSINTTGNQNSAFGYSALNKNLTGTNNTALGYYAGYYITSGSNLTMVGYQAYASSPSATNEVTLGNNTVTTLRCNTQTITGLSDARDKKNIKNLTLGINFIMKIKPRQFNWDRREWYKNNVSDGSKTNETPTAGFIAQELDEVQTSEKAEWLNLVLKSNKERWEATYGNLLPVMVKAIQDLKNENDELKTANSKLAVVTSEAIKNINNENKELKIKLANYEQIQNMLVVEIEKLKSSNTRITKVNLGLK